jgi:hypothetical protein
MASSAASSADTPVPLETHTLYTGGVSMIKIALSPGCELDDLANVARITCRYDNREWSANLGEKSLDPLPWSPDLFAIKYYM